MRCDLLQTRSARKPQADACVNSRDPIVRHDAPTSGQRFRLARRERLPDIKDAKKYKTQEQLFPVERGAQGDQTKRRRVPVRFGSSPPNGDSASEQERQVLSRYFVNYHVLRIFLAEALGDAIGSPDPEGSDKEHEDELRP